MRLIVKRSKKRITPEVLEAYAELKALDPKRTDCIRDIRCDVPNASTHCSDCLRHIELNRYICKVLDIRPWEPDPLDPGELHDRFESALKEKK